MNPEALSTNNPYNIPKPNIGIHSFSAWSSALKGQSEASTVYGRQVAAWLKKNESSLCCFLA